MGELSMLKQELIKKYLKLGRGVWRYNVASKLGQVKPESVIINLTYWCNSRCVMCNIWQIRPKKELTYEDWVEVMKDPIFSEIRNLTVSGGEPSMYKDYVKTVKLFLASMPKLTRLVVNSNGFTPKLLIRDMEEIASECQRRGIKLGANVSIDGVRDVHDSLRRIKNGFDLCAETVSGYKKLAKKYGFNVTVSSLILRQNVHRYKDMVKWLKDTKTDGSFQIVGFHDTYLRNAETKKDLSINQDVKQTFLEVLESILESKPKGDVGRYYWADMINMYKNNGNRTSPCPFLTDDFVVDSLGDVYYCLSVRAIGNWIKEGRSISEIYYDPKNIEFRKKLPQGACKKCNSGCDVHNATAFDLKRYLYHRMTGKLWQGNIDR
jgi:sulfatase maturation enzyme AslB (radical SAM superfamily)